MIVNNRTDVAATGLEPFVHHDEDDQTEDDKTEDDHTVGGPCRNT
jgi:hypothetical protein